MIICINCRYYSTQMKRFILHLLCLSAGFAAIAQNPAAVSGYSPGYTATYVGHTDYSAWPYNRYSSGYSGGNGYHQTYFLPSGFRTVDEENRIAVEAEAARRRERDREEGITPAQADRTPREPKPVTPKPKPQPTARKK